MTWWQVITLAGSFAGTGVVLAAIMLRTTGRLDRRIDSVHSEGVADRRALQTAMDDFRKEMLRLAERQTHVEGRLDAAE